MTVSLVTLAGHQGAIALPPDNADKPTSPAPQSPSVAWCETKLGPSNDLRGNTGHQRLVRRRLTLGSQSAVGDVRTSRGRFRRTDARNLDLDLHGDLRDHNPTLLRVERDLEGVAPRDDNRKSA